MNILFIVFQAWLILMAIGIDAFVCSFGYGVSKVKIPFKSVMVINVICSALLAAGLFFGIFMGNFISVETTEWIAFTILFLIGIFKIFDSTIKK